MTYNPLDDLSNAPTKIKQGQVVYLELVMKMSRDTISYITGYARSSIRTFISKLKNKIEIIKTYFDDIVHYAKGFVAYIVKLYGKNKYLKVGFTKDINRRRKELSQKYGDVEIVKLYRFDDDDTAHMMEDILRKYYKKTKKFYPKDRFEIFSPTEEDYKYFDKQYNKLLTEF